MSAMRTKTIKYKLVEYIPERLDDGVLYVSERYRTAAHKCCCGCGEEVITPLNPTDWRVKIEAGRVSLYPSIGNWSFACRSHYWIRKGQVEWSYEMSDQAIQHGREMDRKLKERYFDEKNRDDIGSHPPSFFEWLGEIFSKIKKWFGW